ncbi:GNAT family N-acetyltransferase [Streptomyces mayteni]
MDELTRVGEPTVRAAVAADAAAVLAFWREAAEGVSISDDLEGVGRLIARDPEALLLAERDGVLVGTVIAGFDGWRCHLYRLAVAPVCRRQGVAKALLAAAERRFAALGGRRADAMVLHHNELAHPAWAAGGYRPQPEWERWVKPLAG